MKHLYLLTVLLCSATFSFAQWNTNTNVNLEVASQSTGDLQMVNTSDGKTWIAWYHNNNGNYDMRAQLLDVNGNKLLGANGVLVSNITSGSATFVFNICLDAQNNLLIAFQYQVASANNAVINKVNTDGTLPWGSAGIVLGPGLSPYPAVLSTGEIVIAWNNSTPATLYMQKLSAAGVAMWSAPVSVLVGTSFSTRGQIVPNSNGTFTLVFQRRGVGISTTPYVQRYNSEGGAIWPAPVQISTLTTSGARYYSIVADRDTTYFGYYAAQGNRFLAYVQRINPDGTIPWGANGSVFSNYATGSDPYQQTINIARNQGSPYLWAVCSFSTTNQADYGVFVQKYDVASGNRLLNLNGKEVFPISANRDQIAGGLTLINDAPLFMSYDANYKIYATRLNSTGDFVWPTNRVELSSTTAGAATPKGRFAFTDAVNGQAVAVWTENRGIENRPYAQNITENGNTGVLPVALTNLRASRNGAFVDVAWSTTSEYRNTGFYVERSNDGSSFNALAFVPTKAANGSSNTNLAYNLTDVVPEKGTNHYRLKQVDLDGKPTFSKVIAVKFDGKTALSITKTYPGGSKGLLNVTVESGKATQAFYLVTDAHGRMLQKSVAALQPGNNLLKVDVSHLAAGTYFFTIETNDAKATKKWQQQ